MDELLKNQLQRLSRHLEAAKEQVTDPVGSGDLALTQRRRVALAGALESLEAELHETVEALRS
jgi:hypothetical protein